MHIYIVLLQMGTFVDSIPVPNSAALNGMAVIPRNPGVVLGADLIEGRMFSINILTGETKEVLKRCRACTCRRESGRPSIGTNGLRVIDDFVYFTSPNRVTFFPISHR